MLLPHPALESAGKEQRVAVLSSFIIVIGLRYRPRNRANAPLFIDQARFARLSIVNLIRALIRACNGGHIKDSPLAPRQRETRKVCVHKRDNVPFLMVVSFHGEAYLVSVRISYSHFKSTRSAWRTGTPKWLSPRPSHLDEDGQHPPCVRACVSLFA